MRATTPAAVRLIECFQGILVWRIWTVHSRTSRHNVERIGNFPLLYITRVIIESGLLYTLFVLLCFATELAGSNLLYVFASTVRIRLNFSRNQC